jgi:hypothetical protein
VRSAKEPFCSVRSRCRSAFTLSRDSLHALSPRLTFCGSPDAEKF